MRLKFRTANPPSHWLMLTSPHPQHLKNEWSTLPIPGVFPLGRCRVCVSDSLECSVDDVPHRDLREKTGRQLNFVTDPPCFFAMTETINRVDSS